MKKSTMAGIGAAAVLAMAALAAGCGSSSDSASGQLDRHDHDDRRRPRRGARRATRLQSDVDYTDPALAYYSASWNIEYATCAKLLNYPDTGRHPRARTLQPEVAEAMPTVSNGDKTYTFTVRDGFKFSPPSGAPVTAMTFKKVIERDLSKAMNSPAQSFAGDILGAKEFTAGTAKEVSGVKVDGNKISITPRQAGSRLPLAHRDAVLLRGAGEHADQLERRRSPRPARARTTSSRAPRAGRSCSAKNPNYGGDRKASLDQHDLHRRYARHRVAARQRRATQTDWAADGSAAGRRTRSCARDYGADEPGSEGRQAAATSSTRRSRSATSP